MSAIALNEKNVDNLVQSSQEEIALSSLSSPEHSSVNATAGDIIINGVTATTAALDDVTASIHQAAYRDIRTFTQFNDELNLRPEHSSTSAISFPTSLHPPPQWHCDTTSDDEDEISLDDDDHCNPVIGGHYDDDLPHNNDDEDDFNAPSSPYDEQQTQPQPLNSNQEDKHDHIASHVDQAKENTGHAEPDLNHLKKEQLDDRSDKEAVFQSELLKESSQTSVSALPPISSHVSLNTQAEKDSNVPQLSSGSTAKDTDDQYSTNLSNYHEGHCSEEQQQHVVSAITETQNEGMDLYKTASQETSISGTSELIVTPFEDANSDPPNHEQQSRILSQSFLNQDVDKTTIFVELQSWEKSRLIRTDKVHNLLDPIVEDLIRSVQVAKDVNSYTIKFLKDRVKLSNEIVQRLRGSNLTTKTIRFGYQRHQSITTANGNTSEDGATATDTNYSANPTSKGPNILTTTPTSDETVDKLDTSTNNSSTCVPVIHRWTKALCQCNEQEAQSHEVLAEAIETELLYGKLSACNDFDKASNLLLGKVKECRSRLRLQNKEVMRHWYDFQKQFRENSKTGSSRSTAQVLARQSRSRTHSTVQSPTIEGAHPKRGGSTVTTGGQLTGTGYVPAKETRDSWLYERRYLHSVVVMHQMHLMYYQLLGQAIADLQQLEQWRSSIVKDAILIFASKMRETLGFVASALGSIHAMIDPSGFMKAKAAFMARNTSGSEDAKDVNAADTMQRNATDKEEESVFKNKLDHTTPSVNDENEDNNEICEDIMMPEFKLEESSVFNTVRDLIGSVAAPEAQFVIKQGHVRRQAGMFGKWSEGMLVLTWDRYLHMFRSHDDSSPVWSAFMPSSDVRLVEEKGGDAKTVEIREKKNLFVVLGSRSFYFRAFSEVELNSWLTCLTLATSSDENSYRREALAVARSADVQEMQDYSLWVQQQELQDITTSQIS